MWPGARFAGIAREEFPAPVGAVLPFDTPEEAVRIANDSIDGLAAAVRTRDVGRGHRMARDIEAGVIRVNCFDHGDVTRHRERFKAVGQRSQQVPRERRRPHAEQFGVGASRLRLSTCSNGRRVA